MATSFDFVLHRQYNDLNVKLFNGELPSTYSRNFKLMFNRGMSRSLGRCKWKLKYGQPVQNREYAITISDKLMYEPTQQLKVLLHEMVHLYMYITDGVDANAGHGPRWQQKWIEIGRAHDAVFGTTYMETHARSQCSSQYSGCREKQAPMTSARRTYAPAPTAAPAAAQTRMTKWTLTCPLCGHVHHAKALNGRVLKLALTSDNVRHGKNGCTHRLVATRNW